MESKNLLDENSLLKSEKFKESILQNGKKITKEMIEFIFEFWNLPNSFELIDEVVRISHLQYSSITLLKEFLELQKYFNTQKDKNLNSENEIFSLDDFLSHFQTTKQRLLLQRRKTLGIIERHVKYKEKKVYDAEIIDVGGQRNERRKWKSSLKILRQKLMNFSSRIGSS